MQRISVNLTNNCDGNKFNYNNNLPVTGNKNYAIQKSFETGFLTVIRHLLDSPRHAAAQGTQFCTLIYFFM